MKVSRFHNVECSMRRMGVFFPSLTFSYVFVALVLIGVLICGIIIVIFDISRIKAVLDQLYWVAENTHSGMVGIMIEYAESQLYQRQTILMGLAGLAALIIVSLMLIKRKLTGKAVRDIRSNNLSEM